ncbi:Centrosomal protein [Echinococcus granulosus]|uniref:Centrosomal protein of 164 kDa n=1 Tax=Echinococcus granulosus TaxID=6210 RepID=A0A068WRY9_ECHGR|nr:Centrosomal protein [Echinococcus granulosus]CDS21250.1 centrosomal protein of 164 kDa [Echinococcus granulosus]
MADSDSSDPVGSYLRNCTILEEVENLDPTDEEVRMYAWDIGIDPDKEADLLHIAREGLSAPVPKGWIVLQNRKGSVFYQQKCSGICIWEHPLDAQFRLRVVEAKSKKSSGQNVKPGESLAIGNEQTPVKTETIYQALPEPRASLNVSGSEFKVPSVPQRTVNVPNTDLSSPGVDSPSTSASVHNLSGLNLPHVNISPTGGSKQRKVLSEINANDIASAIKTSSRRHHGAGEDAGPTGSVNVVSSLANRFTSAVRISALSQHRSQRQRRYSNNNSTRRLFDDPDGDVTSCLFSPPESPQSRPRHRRGDKVRPSTNETPLRSEPSASPAERMVSELDGNLRVQYLLEEQKRLHEKIAFLKVTYKAYKLRLANVNTNIKMIQSAAATTAATPVPTFHTHPPVIGAGISGSRTSPANHSTATANSAPLRPTSSRRFTAVRGSQQNEKHNHPGNQKQRARSIQNAAASRTSRSNVLTSLNIMTIQSTATTSADATAAVPYTSYIHLLPVADGDTIGGPASLTHRSTATVLTPSPQFSYTTRLPTTVQFFNDQG